MQTSTDATSRTSSAKPELASSEPAGACGLSGMEALVNVDPEMIGSLTRVQDRLILVFKDGTQLTIENYFRFEASFQRQLNGMTPAGDIWFAFQKEGSPEQELKYNFSQPLTALAFTGSAIVAGALITLLL
jgi:hypothetical protein